MGSMGLGWGMRSGETQGRKKACGEINKLSFFFIVYERSFWECHVGRYLDFAGAARDQRNFYLFCIVFLVHQLETTVVKRYRHCLNK